MRFASPICAFRACWPIWPSTPDSHPTKAAVRSAVWGRVGSADNLRRAVRELRDQHPQLAAHINDRGRTIGFEPAASLDVDVLTFAGLKHAQRYEEALREVRGGFMADVPDGLSAWVDAERRRWNGQAARVCELLAARDWFQGRPTARSSTPVGAAATTRAGRSDRPRGIPCRCRRGRRSAGQAARFSRRARDAYPPRASAAQRHHRPPAVRRATGAARATGARQRRFALREDITGSVGSDRRRRSSVSR